MVYQICFGKISKKYTAYVNLWKQWAKENGHEYKIEKLSGCDDVQKRWRIADSLRMEMLAQEAGVIYADVDCKPTAAFEYVNDGDVHAGYSPIGVPGAKASPDSFVIWGPCDYFKTIISLRDTVYTTLPPAWPRKALRRAGGVVQIPPEQYVHDSIGFNKLNTQGGENVSNNSRA